MRTCVRMTAQGSPYARLRRALDRGNATGALSTAAELQTVPLAEALEICLLLRDVEPARYQRAAVRWHARFCREVPGVAMPEAELVLASLQALQGPGAEAGANALAVVCAGRGLGAAAEALERWLAR